MLELSLIEQKYFEQQYKEAIAKDNQIKSWIAEGYCVHKLGEKSSDCSYCQNILNPKLDKS